MSSSLKSENYKRNCQIPVFYIGISAFEMLGLEVFKNEILFYAVCLAFPAVLPQRLGSEYKNSHVPESVRDCQVCSSISDSSQYQKI